MSRTLTVSDKAYARLETEARQKGFESVERLLESPGVDEAELRRRKQFAAEVNAIWEDLSRKYGKMPDSTDLIREDRER